MEKEEIKIPKYVVKTLTEKLRDFIEDNEKSFKFHPWQVTSTLNAIQKSINFDLPERAIHHLHDTGTAYEILNFTKQNDNSLKIEKVRNYLYSCLGLNFAKKKPPTENNNHVLNHESLLFNSLRKERVFEVRRLVDAVIQQLQHTSKFYWSPYHQPNTWKKFKYNQLVAKQQPLAHCNYTSCLFHRAGDRVKRKKKVVLKSQTKKQKQNFIKKNIKSAVPRITFTNVQTFSKNEISIKDQNSPQNKIKLSKPKMVESTTQTSTWSLKNVPTQRESLFEGAVTDISNEDESLEDTEGEFYCKSDTLNDASMITEEIASDYIPAMPQMNAEIQSEKVADHTSSSKPSIKGQLKSGTRSEQMGSSKSSFKCKHMSEEELNQLESSKSSLKSKFKSEKESLHEQFFIESKLEGSLLEEEKVSLSEHLSKKSEDLLNSNVIKSAKKPSLTRCKASINEEMLIEDGNGKNIINHPIFSIENENVKEVEENTTNDLENLEEPKDEILTKHFNENDDNNKENETKIAPDKDIIPSIEKPNPPSINESLAENEKEDIIPSIEKPNPPSINESLTENEKEEIPEEKPESSDHFTNLTVNMTEAAVSSDNETTYSPRSLSESTAEDDISERSSSIKENDNMSAEYSSHWTEEYSSTEASDSEDEDFKKQFTEYKRTLLEEDEGIAASCEDEISFNTEKQSIKATDTLDEEQVSQPVNEIGRTKGLLIALASQDEHIFENLNTLDENVLEIVDEDGWNMLHLAASKGLDSFVENLLQHGLPVDSVTKNGNTALQLAIINDHLNCCQILLKHGASLTTEDGSFDEDFIENVGNTLSSPVKKLLENYKDNYMKVQTLVEILNHFGRQTEIISRKLPKNILQTLADLTIEDGEANQDPHE